MLKPISTESIPVPFVARHYCISLSSESSAGASFDVFGGRTSRVRWGCKGQVVEWGVVEWSGVVYGLRYWVVMGLRGKQMVVDGLVKMGRNMEFGVLSLRNFLQLSCTLLIMMIEVLFVLDPILFRLFLFLS
ncbi:hypothetical protein Q3G72_023651 [Acer saccharum]|nr:hypothetical protein Q3G72_023651 [Acer saccharum]